MPVRFNQSLPGNLVMFLMLNLLIFGGATLADVRLMKEAVGERMQVKASGGIRDLDAALAFIAAGADRLGTSSGLALVEAYKNNTP